MIMCEQFTLHNPKENIVLRKIRERRLSFFALQNESILHVVFIVFNSILKVEKEKTGKQEA